VVDLNTDAAPHRRLCEESFSLVFKNSLRCAGLHHLSGVTQGNPINHEHEYVISMFRVLLYRKKKRELRKTQKTSAKVETAQRLKVLFIELKSEDVVRATKRGFAAP
jgi:hypothetical protein